MLLAFSGGVREVSVEASNVRQIIDQVDALRPGFKSKLVEEGIIRSNLAVAIDGGREG